MLKTNKKTQKANQNKKPKTNQTNKKTPKIHKSDGYNQKRDEGI